VLAVATPLMLQLARLGSCCSKNLVRLFRKSNQLLFGLLVLIA
jgi:hypothetical protein